MSVQENVTRDGDPDGARDPDALFSVLDDRDCRAFLAALDEPRTATELSERCDVPSSTTYRKLHRLSALGLVDARREVCGAHNHQARYHRTAESVSFEFSDSTLDVD